jgi:hypothetical protein
MSGFGSSSSSGTSKINDFQGFLPGASQLKIKKKLPFRVGSINDPSIRFLLSTFVFLRQISRLLFIEEGVVTGILVILMFYMLFFRTCFFLSLSERKEGDLDSRSSPSKNVDNSLFIRIHIIVRVLS